MTERDQRHHGILPLPAGDDRSGEAVMLLFKCDVLLDNDRWEWRKEAADFQHISLWPDSLLEKNTAEKNKSFAEKKKSQQ